MPRLKITRTHNTTLAEASNRVAGLVEGFRSRFHKHIKEETWSDDKTSARCRGRGFDATFSVSESQVQVDVDLSFVLTPIKGKVESTIEQKLLEAFPA